MHVSGRNRRPQRALARAALAAVALWWAPAGADQTARHGHGDHETDHQATGHHDHGHQELGAHAHGHALLGVVREGDALAVELRVPAVNVVGFEHAPVTDAEHAAVREALAAFEGGAPLAPPAAGRCEVEHAATGLAGMSEGHGELHVEVHLRCERPERVEALEAGRLFEVLRGVETIDAQVVTETSQGRVTLTASDAVLRLAR